MGYTVDILPDRHVDSSVGKAAVRYVPSLSALYYSRFLRQELQLLDRASYDVIVVIQGEGLNLTTVKWLKNNFASARINFYSWDNFRNKPKSVLNSLDAYDRVISFDEKDALTYGAEFKPLFFVGDREKPIAQQPEKPLETNLIFIGTVHSDRAKLIKKFERLATDGNISFYKYMYLQAPWVFYFRRYILYSTGGFSRKDFRTKALSQSAVRQMTASSRAVLDIEHPKQTGATMRTFESLALGKKLVTCNQAVRKLDIYSPENVYIFNRSSPTLPPSHFFISPFKSIPEKTLDKYSLKNWVAFVSGDKEQM